MPILAPKNLKDNNMQNARNAFSMIELVFVIVILGVLAAVAVPRFVATRLDATVATLRSDASATTKAIVAKVFADNLDTTHSKAPHPNDTTKTYSISWNEWILEVGGLDRSRWIQASALKNAYNNTADRGISPDSRYFKGIQYPCGSSAMIEILKDGNLYFNPGALATDTSIKSNEPELCKQLRKSYESSGGVGNRITPLTSTGTIEF